MNSRNPYDNNGQYVKGLGPQTGIQPGPYLQSSTQYQQSQQPSYYQPQGQYQTQNQHPGQGQYQPIAQYQQPSQYSQQSGQFHQPGQYQVVTDNYSGQYSENQNSYDRPQKPSNDNSGEYNKKYDEEESTGPPKGFFYSFDYPVGIIVNKEGLVKQGGNVKDVYNENKAKYESQLLSGHGDKTNQGYLYLKNHQ